MKYLGAKYQLYVDDELVILRLVNIKSEDKFVMVDKNNKHISMTSEQLKKCIRLEPDAMLNIMTTTSKDGIRDVYTCVNKAEDMKNGISNPALVLRQNIYSSSKNAFGNVGNDIYVGECIVRCGEETLNDLLDFEKIDDSISICLYVDDTTKDLDKFVIGHNVRKIDEVLRHIKSQNTNDMIKGYCESVKELLDDNNFIGYYRDIFNIMQVDFPIELGNNISDDGVIKLNEKQINRLEHILSCKMIDVKALKYDKDIDISKIVTTTHIMISDETENIYLISFINGGPIIDSDIERAMSIKK